jgi:CDP-L-myo-inositol myo-inositolphosphotransferase
MESEKMRGAPAALPAMLVMVFFRHRERAEQRIAGLSAAARIVSEACQAGARDFWIILDEDDARPSNATSDDIARACGHLSVRYLSRGQLAQALSEQGPRELLFLCGTHLVTKPALSSFLAAGTPSLTFRDTIVAARFSSLEEFQSLAEAAPGRSDAGAAEDGVVPLDPPAIATRTILRATGKRSDGPVSRWINRPISRRISAVLLRIEGVAPSHVTLFSMALSVTMFACFLAGGESGRIAGAILYQIVSVIDGVDGEIARASYRSSARGAALDTAADMATNVMFFLGLTISLAQGEGERYAVIGGYGCAAFLIGLGLIAWLVRRSGGPPSFNLLKVFYGAQFSASPARPIVAAFTAATSRDFFALACLLTIIAGMSKAILWIFASFATVWLVGIVAAAPAIVRTQNRASSGAN